MIPPSADAALRFISDVDVSWKTAVVTLVSAGIVSRVFKLFNGLSVSPAVFLKYVIRAHFEFPYYFILHGRRSLVYNFGVCPSLMHF
jgi:hypothetical protein